MFSAEFTDSHLTHKHLCGQVREAFSIWNVRSWISITVELRRGGSLIWRGPAFAGLAIERLYDEIVFTCTSVPTAGHRYFIDFSDTGLVPPPVDRVEQFLGSYDTDTATCSFDFADEFGTALDLTGANQPARGEHVWLLPSRIQVDAYSQGNTNISFAVNTPCNSVYDQDGTGAARPSPAWKSVPYQPSRNLSLDGDPFNTGAAYLKGMAQYLEHGRMAYQRYWNGSADRHRTGVGWQAYGYTLKFAGQMPTALPTATIDAFEWLVNVYGLLCRDIPWRRP